MKIKILVVDDSLTMRKIIIKSLVNNGIDDDYISEAEDGLMAYGKVKTNHYDLILTDWNMPKMNGLKFVKAVRQMPKYKQTPIIMITTEGGKKEVVQALKEGVNNYIIKPFSHETLRIKLNNIISKYI